MVNEEPKVSMNGQYSTNDTAKLLGVSRTTLWRMADARMIKCSSHLSNGRRFYYGHEILRFWRARS